MMIETTRDIRLKDIRPTAGVSSSSLSWLREWCG